MSAAFRSTETERKTDRRAGRLTLIAMSLGFCVVQLDVSVVNVAVKPIGASLGGGISSLQLLVSAYTVTFVAHLAPLQAGLALALIMVAVMAANLTARAIATRLGLRRASALGASLMAVACAGLLGVGAGTGYGVIVVQLLASDSAVG